jgi:anti-sigma-K factor RskA
MTDVDSAVTAPEADELLAIELALGLLEPAPRFAAEERVRNDPAFAALFDRWHARALALLEGHEQRPSASVWTAIVRRLPADHSARALRWWQGATALAASVALALGATLAFRPEPAPIVRVQPAPQPLVAVLVSPERRDLVAVRYDPDTGRLSALPTALDPGAGDAQLWVIPAGGKPVSLGLLPRVTRAERTPVPDVATLIAPGATLAVSLEPRGGAAGPAPTRPVILTGTVAPS